jgi:hypothetical protein
MPKLRALLILLLCVALPYSATAAMLHGMACHHDGLGSVAETAQHEHQPADEASEHAMHGHHHHHDTAASSHASDGDHGCDCSVKCSCEHHCASGCSLASMAPLEGIRLFGSSNGHESVAYASLLSDMHSRMVFRPPIAALTSAA